MPEHFPAHRTAASSSPIHRMENVFRLFGKAYAKLPSGWRLTLLSSHTEFERTFGRTAEKKRKLYNGMLKCDAFFYGASKP